MEYERLKPQKVVHSTGTIIQFSDRYSLQVISPDGKVADIEVDDSTVMAIFKESLTGWVVSGKEVLMSEEEKNEVLKIVEGALPVMGVRYVLVPGSDLDKYLISKKNT